jgi:hypothetical protein
VADFLETCLSKYSQEGDISQTLDMEKMARDAEAYLKKSEDEVIIEDSADEKETLPGALEAPEEVHVV